MHIKRVSILPGWSYRDEEGNSLSPAIFDLLERIRESGKLTVAAKEVGMSYRSAWNLLTKSAAFFDSPLVDKHRGRGAMLTPLGEKLLWSERRISARLGPQLDNLTSELNTEIQRVLSLTSPLLRIHASHGYAVALLPKYADAFQLDLQYKSIEEALSALNRGDCDLAGFDIPIHNVSKKVKQFFKTYLNQQEHKIISFVSRQQGLILQRGNPKKVKDINDLIRSDIRFINRQKNSGTRNLLDELLRLKNIPARKIGGFNDEEFTHSAIAAYIASDMADVGFGIEAAARHFGLDFIPITSEYYMLACRKKTLTNLATQKLIDVMNDPVFHQEIATLPGYAPLNCGSIIDVNNVIPQ